MKYFWRAITVLLDWTHLGCESLNSRAIVNLRGKKLIKTFLLITFRIFSNHIVRTSIPNTKQKFQGKKIKGIIVRGVNTTCFTLIITLQSLKEVFSSKFLCYVKWSLIIQYSMCCKKHTKRFQEPSGLITKEKHGSSSPIYYIGRQFHTINWLQISTSILSDNSVTIFCPDLSSFNSISLANILSSGRPRTPIISVNDV